MADLIVVESPSKVKDVEKYVRKCGLDAKVLATVGHVLDLPKMAEGAAVDLEQFAPTKLVPRDASAARQAERLRAAIAAATRVIVATDPDREGEAIAAQVWRWIPPGRGRRARFKEITAGGIATGIAQMKDNLNAQEVDASVTRRVVDRLAGWHATALVFEKLPQRRGASAGRLQSAALKLVVERFREYENFRPETTFGIRLQLRTRDGATFTARLQGPEAKPAVFATRKEASAIPIPKTLRVASLATEERQEKPRPPFQATSWLQVAQKALGLSVKDATAATQALFETGCTTYPRTDSVRVAEDAVAWARREIARRFGAAFVPPAPWEHRDRGDVQGAHEAIRPTLEDDATALKARATGQWGDAYALIEARFLASQAASRRMKRTEALLVGGDQRFLAVGDVEVFPGWRKILGTDAKEEEAAASKAPPKQEAEKEAQSSLPKLSEGESVEVSATEVLEITTKPKPLFSQAGLVAELERRGIGRPSTYHSVVPLITKRGWVEERVPEQKKGGGRKRLPVLVPTALGIDLCDFLNTSLPGLVNYEFTAELEKALDDVEHGRRSRLEVGQQWWKRFALELAAAQKLPARRVDSPDLGPCSRCLEEGRQGRLRLVEGKRKDGTAFRFAGCDADSKTAKVCGFTAPVDSRGRVLNGTPCEVCAEVMRPVERRDGGHSLVCRKDGWFLADREWRLVRAPKCSSCTQSMVHRERSESRGKFFWACFADSVFADSDQFGRVSEFRGKGANGKGSARTG